MKYLDEVYQARLDTLQQRTAYPDLARARWDLVEKLTVVGSEKKSPLGNLPAPEDVDERLPSTSQPNRLKQSDSLSFWEAQLGLARQDGPEPTDLQVSNVSHSRLLMSLKASYSHQYSMGILPSRPFRMLIWAIDKAIVYNSR